MPARTIIRALCATLGAWTAVGITRLAWAADSGIETGGPQELTQGTQKFKEWLDWGVGPGLDIVIVVGFLIGLLLWNTAPKTGGIGMAVKAVGSAFFALPILLVMLRIKHGAS